MPKYINVDEAIEHFRKWEFTDDFPLIKETLDEIPSADVVKVKHGEWVPCDKRGFILTEMMRREGKKWYGFKCSNCGFIYKGNALIECDFCPKCGAIISEWRETE